MTPATVHSQTKIDALKNGFINHIPVLENFLETNMIKNINAELLASSSTDSSRVVEALKTGTVVAQSSEKVFGIPIYIAFDEHWIPLLASTKWNIEESEINETTRDLMKEFTVQLLETAQLSLQKMGISIELDEVQLVDPEQMNKFVVERDYFMAQVDITGKFKIEGKKHSEMAMIVTFGLPPDAKITGIPGISETNKDKDNTPVVTESAFNRFEYNWLTILTISSILILEAVGAYTLVAYNYPVLYEIVYEKPVDLGAFYEIENITVNPSGTNGSGFLVASIGIQVRKEEDVQRIRQKNIMIRDAIITELGRKTVEELSKMQTREEVKQKIGIIINELIDKQAVKDLYFTEYVMQVY